MTRTKNAATGWTTRIEESVARVDEEAMSNDAASVEVKRLARVMCQRLVM